MTPMRWILLAAFAVASAVMFVLDRLGLPLADLSEGRSLAAFLAVAAGVGALYELSVALLALRVRVRRGAPSEVRMLGGLLRFVAILAVVLVFFDHLGKLSGSWAAIAGFAGLLMGWSLQAPVSGLAAWVMVNVKRPFRVGDRVMLPAWGLIGDVVQVGMMYTVLNQVGGTVGSEEAAGRHILIPNAMLFGNVVINYTPQHAAAFVLDEVIVRITYDSNWDVAEQILLEAAHEVTDHIIRQTGQKPYIRSDLYDYGVYMRLRYTTAATDRPRIVHEITKRIFREFQARPEVDFAIPFVYSGRVGLQAGAAHLGPRAAPSVTNVQVDEVDEPQAADEPGRVADMARRITEQGLLQPIVVERRADGRYAILAGHLRFQAVKMLGWKSVPGIVRDPAAGGLSRGADAAVPPA